MLCASLLSCTCPQVAPEPGRGAAGCPVLLPDAAPALADAWRTPGAQLHVVVSGPHVGFFSHAAGGRFMQIRRSGTHRLAFFSPRLGVYEQWAVRPFVCSASVQSAPLKLPFCPPPALPSRPRLHASRESPQERWHPRRCRQRRHFPAPSPSHAPSSPLPLSRTTKT